MRILLLLFFLTTSIFAQTKNLEGKVIDATTNSDLFEANVLVKETSFGTTTNENGEFLLAGNFDDNNTLQISYLGYEKKEITIADFLASNKVIKLLPTDISLDKIIVNGIIAEEGVTPTTFSKINRKEIEENYTVQDLPEYLSYLPSTTFYSENGNGIGYNYLSIRGFDQRRISISINGIPQNDPEDHNIYWLDIPDLLESTELIQVQRGAGAGAIGYPSIGGSINIITSPFSDKPKFELSTSVGSYNTRKYSAKFSSGLIDGKYSVYVKLSKMLSDGYRDNSWIDFNSYHVSAVRYDENVTTQLNFYGGPVSDGLAFYGLPKEYIKDKELRKTNFVAPREIENFSQPHYEFLNEIKLSDNLKLNTAIFLVKGEGFFDYDGSWSIYYDDYFRLKENGYDPEQIPINSLIHAVVKNTQWGVIPKISWEHGNGEMIAGIEYRNHRSKHWGGITFAENIPAGVPDDYQYYYYEGAKDILNAFVNENYYFTPKFNVLGEIQLAYHEYKLFNEKYLGNDISIDGLYLNPRIGLNYNLNNELNTYVSFAIVTREPRLKSYYDAAESSGGEVPQFEVDQNGNYDFSSPLVKPETMHDLELGARYSSELISLNGNLFYMLFNDEIVKKGQLDRFGQPITGNVDQSVHTGIEIEGQVKLNNYFDVIFNASYSKNYVSDGSTFISITNNDGGDEVKELSLVDNSIAGFPEMTANIILNAKYKGLNAQLSAKYVGDYYSDNYDKNLTSLNLEYNDFIGYSDNKVDAYLVANFYASYEFQLEPVMKNIKIFGQVNNIFDELYAAYATGGDFFPAAERNFLIGMKLGF